VLSALSEIDSKIIALMPNRDPDSEIIREKLTRFFANNKNVELHRNMGDDYILEMERSYAVVGNSSSGLIEAPACDTFTVNIGNRQDGRERGNSILDAHVNKWDIIDAINSIREAGYTPKITNPYDRPLTREVISSFLATCNLEFVKWTEKLY
jgi:UDP-N-acetylglucosamine 2-epimerase